jgi:hypothetical protein
MSEVVETFDIYAQTDTAKQLPISMRSTISSHARLFLSCIHDMQTFENPFILQVPSRNTMETTPTEATLKAHPNS